MNIAIKNGIIDLPNIEKQVAMKERERYLSQHKYSIWENKQGMWCTHLPKTGHNNNRMLYKRKTREEIEDLIVDFFKDNELNPTLDELFEEYNNNRKELKKVSKSTIWRDEKRYKKYFSEFGKKRIRSISPNDVEDFLEAQIPRFEMTAKEFSELKTITKKLFQRIKKRGLTDIQIMDIINNLDISDKRFRQVIRNDEEEIFYDDEMQKIIEYCYNHPKPVNTGIALMFATGIRIGELATLKNEDFEGLSFKVKRTETRYESNVSGKYNYEVKEFPKTRAGYRTVVIPKSFSWIIDRINPDSEFAFENNNGRIRTFTFSKQLRRINQKLGIPQKSAHKIRKTYCSILLDNNIDRSLIQKQVGHTNIGLTEDVYHRDRKSLDKKIDIISSIPEFSSLQEKII